MVNVGNLRVRQTVGSSSSSSAFATGSNLMQIVEEITKNRTMTIPAETVRREICQFFADSEAGGVVTNDFKLSLMDPISKLRIKIPVQSTKCNHFQCFDLYHFLEFSTSKNKGKENKNAWLCPHCQSEAKQGQLRVDGYFQEILLKVGPEPLEVELLPDGQWKEVEQLDFKSVLTDDGDVIEIVPKKKSKILDLPISETNSGGTRNPNICSACNDTLPMLRQILGLNSVDGDGKAVVDTVLKLKQKAEAFDKANQFFNSFASNGNTAENVQREMPVKQSEDQLEERPDPPPIVLLSSSDEEEQEKNEEEEEEISEVLPKNEAKKTVPSKNQIEEQQEKLSELFQEADKHNVKNMKRWRQNERLLFSKDVQELRDAIVAAKEMERSKVLEKRRREKEELAEWKKPRDDLLCDDLKPFPKFQKFIWPEWIPSELCMEILSMYHFLVGFYEIFPKHQQFTLWEVALALVTKRRDAHSQYFRLIRYLLEAVGACIDEDEGDEADLDKPEEIGNEQNKDIDHPVHGAKIRAINIEHALIRDTHGFSVRHMKIDPLTITEVVRLSLLTSGYYTATRRPNRGGMRCFEDAGYLFAQNNMEIMSILEKDSIFDLDPIQRFELADVFVNQLMSHFLFRNLIEKRMEKLADLRRSLRQLQQINYRCEMEANNVLKLKNSEPNGHQQKPYMIRPSKKLLTLRQFLQTLNEGHRITNISEIKQLFLEDKLPWTEMERNEIAEFRLVQNDFFAQEMKLVQEEIFNLNALMGNCFLGRDRAFRSFYFLHYFSVFVIEPPSFEGPVQCSKATPISQANISSLLESIKEPSENDRQNLLIALNACTGDLNCPVHRKNNTYYFYAEENGIEKLLNSLNPRGYREIELADNINLLKNVYAQSLDRVAKKYSPDGLSFKAFGLHNPMKDVVLVDSSQVEFLKFVIEKILKLEQNIHEKQLGKLQITVDRDQWRTLLQETGDTSTVCFDNIVYLQNSLSDEILYTSADLDPTMHKLNQIQKLGIALLQVFQGTMLVCLQDPFVGEDEQNGDIILPTSTYVIWQKELVKCQSPSALALFVQTFSKVVNWDFVHPLNKCPACKRKFFEFAKPVVCVQCGEAYHSRCVSTSSAQANWYCPTCFAEVKQMEKNEIVENQETNSLNIKREGREKKADSEKRMPKMRVEYSPTPSSSSSNNNRSTERSSMGENESYRFVRVRRPVASDSADSLYEFFGRQSNVEKEVKRRKK